MRASALIAFTLALLVSGSALCASGTSTRAHPSPATASSSGDLGGALVVDDDVSVPGSKIARAATPAPNAVAAPAPTTSVRQPLPIVTIPTKPLAPTPPQIWVAHHGQWLSDTIAEWSKRAGWQEPQWSLHDEMGQKVDYQIDSDAPFAGDFPHAAKQLFDAYVHANADHPMDVQINVFQHVVVVTNATASN